MKKQIRQAAFVFAAWAVLAVTAVIAVCAAPVTVQAEALSSVNFDSRRYAEQYPDLMCAYGYDHASLWLHYITFGKREGRIVYDNQGNRAEAAEEQLAPAPMTREQIFANTMISLINAERAKAGAAPLALAEDCMGAAGVRGNDFVQYQAAGQVVANLPHIRPDGSLFTTAYRCCKGARYGENTYFTYYFTDDDITSFANRTHLAMCASSDHYLRMLNPNFRYAGFSLTHLSDVGQSSWYVVIEEFRD